MKRIIPFLFIATLMGANSSYAFFVAVPSSPVYEVPSPANEAFYFCAYTPAYHCYYRDVNIDVNNYPYYPATTYYNRHDYPPVIITAPAYPEGYIFENQSW